MKRRLPKPKKNVHSSAVRPIGGGRSSDRSDVSSNASWSARQTSFTRSYDPTSHASNSSSQTIPPACSICA